jgi:hypothetical protein
MKSTGGGRSGKPDSGLRKSSDPKPATVSPDQPRGEPMKAEKQRLLDRIYPGYRKKKP